MNNFILKLFKEKEEETLEKPTNYFENFPDALQMIECKKKNDEEYKLKLEKEEEERQKKTDDLYNHIIKDMCNIMNNMIQGKDSMEPRSGRIYSTLKNTSIQNYDPTALEKRLSVFIKSKGYSHLCIVTRPGEVFWEMYFLR